MWWQRESSPEVEAALARVRIFSTLGRRDLAKLASACLLRRYSAGDSILEEGSTGLGMFLITAGRVEVFKTHQGHQVTLAVLGDGDVLGEMALLDDQPRSASAVALEDTECLLLSRDRFRTLLKRRPRIAWPIVPPLARRVRDLQEQLLNAEDPRLALPHADATYQEPPFRSSLSAEEPSTDATALETQHEPPTEIVVSHAEAPPGDSATGMLRAPYALMITGAVGFGESARLCEVFLRSLGESSGLADGRPMDVRDLPKSLAIASKSSWERGQRLPSKLLRTFRDHLRSDCHGKNRE